VSHTFTSLLEWATVHSRLSEFSVQQKLLYWFFWSDRIPSLSEVIKLKHLIFAALSLFNLRRWGVISEIYSLTKFDSPFSVSFAQGGEDLALISFEPKTKGFYLDIGAHHPNRFSVTRLLYDKGWSGINVDANPDIAPDFKEWRPRDTFLNFAVGERSEYVFTRFEESAISTTNLKWKNKFQAEGNLILDEITVPGITLKNLLEKVPIGTKLDLINLDIEGGDVEALSSLLDLDFNLEKLPKWFLIETPIGLESVIDSEQVKILTKLGYRIKCILPMSTLLGR
jgi:FkbM family methyltransferase